MVEKAKVGPEARGVIRYRPIGVVRSPFRALQEMPIQPVSRASAPGRVEIYPEFAAGLKDLDGFSHIILLYHFHRAPRVDLTVTPFLDGEQRGIFATRAPTRPNPIGLSVVALERVDGATLYLENLDILDGTPVLDIKPYVPEFDARPDARTGWLERARGKARGTTSDDRFA
jgi:tRNA-Thr(GGU) m(6)t(6)A37 methyltransferase TsaA